MTDAHAYTQIAALEAEIVRLEERHARDAQCMAALLGRATAAERCAEEAIASRAAYVAKFETVAAQVLALQKELVRAHVRSVLKQQRAPRAVGGAGGGDSSYRASSNSGLVSPASQGENAQSGGEFNPSTAPVGLTPAIVGAGHPGLYHGLGPVLPVREDDGGVDPSAVLVPPEELKRYG